MRKPSDKKRRVKMEQWLRTPEGKAFVHRFRHRTPEDAAEIEKILRK